jgi:hypothetical protein
MAVQFGAAPPRSGSNSSNSDGRSEQASPKATPGDRTIGLDDETNTVLDAWDRRTPRPAKDAAEKVARMVPQKAS